FNTSAIQNEQGEIASWVGAAIDIHDKKVKSDKQSEFMSIACHVLGTPLTTAKAYLQKLQQNLHEETGADMILIKKAADSVERLDRLVAELLDVSKIQRGEFELDMGPFDFNEMLDAANKSIQITHPERKIIKMGEVSRTVSGDKERLKQVVVNLLTNAINYSLENEIIQVNVVEKEEEILVSVTDRGTGIAEENLDKIFEMYFREKHESNEVQGLGIGLPIASEIVFQHKGRIWAESEPGKGSTFYFTISTI
ncbi:MAG TPA: ATP-binding protein, partial [Hanamia sp.]|nr:ATP-binding protein [Hanamia sp.]